MSSTHLLFQPSSASAYADSILPQACDSHLFPFCLGASLVLWKLLDSRTSKSVFWGEYIYATGAVLNQRGIRGRVDECSSIQCFRQTILRGCTPPQAPLPTVTTSVTHPYSGFSFVPWFAFLYALNPAFWDRLLDKLLAPNFLFKALLKKETKLVRQYLQGSLWQKTNQFSSSAP